MFYTKLKRGYKYIPLMVFAVYLIWRHTQISLIADDLVYQDAWKKVSMFSWCKEFYLHWGGRVPLQFLDIVFLNLPMKCWKICNIALILMVMYYLLKFIELYYDQLNDKQKVVILTIACILFSQIPSDIADASIYWITGSFNYLWPFAFLMPALYPFFIMTEKKEVKKWEWALAWIGTFFACYAEQTAAIFVCISIFAIGYSKWQREQIKYSQSALFVFGLLNAGIQYAAPGNHVRFQAELLKWYPDFDMYGLFDRIIFGMIHCIHLLFSQGWIFLILCVLILGIQTIHRTTTEQIFYGAFLMLTFLIREYAIRLNDAPVWDLYNKKLMLELAGYLFWMFWMVWFILRFSQAKSGKLVIGLLFLAVFATGVVMGMSPTIYASGSRVFLSTFLLLVLVMSLVASEVMSSIQMEREV